MQMPNLEQQDAMMIILVTIGGIVLRAGMKIGKILTKIERLEKDVDAIALFVGTPRAIATSTKKQTYRKGPNINDWG